MAAAVLGRTVARGDLRSGDLRSGDRVVEYKGGSTGTPLAFVSAVLGLRFITVFSDAFSESNRLAMEAFGAEVLVEPSEDGRITPDLLSRPCHVFGRNRKTINGRSTGDRMVGLRNTVPVPVPETLFRFVEIAVAVTVLTVVPCV